MITITVDENNAELLLNSLRNYSISYQMNIDYIRRHSLLQALPDYLKDTLEPSERRVNEISALIAAIEIAAKGGEEA